jgi:fluoride exporter
MSPSREPHERHDAHPELPLDSDAGPADVEPTAPRGAVAAVSVGGALGALARWGVSEALPHDGAQFPWSTLVTNVLGCFLLGVLMVVAVELLPHRHLVRPFLGTGVLGGFTTFSTFGLDTRSLLAADRPGPAAAYVVASVALGLAAVVAGLRIAERLTERRTRRLSKRVVR